MKNSTFVMIFLALPLASGAASAGEQGRYVTVSAAGQGLAGITTAKARAGALEPGFTVTGRVVQDAQNIFHIKSASGGVFSAAAALGGEVEKGQRAGSVASEAGETPVSFPARGVVTAAASSGTAVRAGEILYTITALDPVWAVLDVSERDISRLRYGGKVTARSASWPGKSFAGEIVFISPEIDE
ncbi:MAG TPA: efflux RND transporter periplasmic adaptor subunit, partial [Elusimicrobiales bacterium]|nr:efflux RND transporter periplasmic adaptor subunit [Elusimicrobiales bacterium]